MVWYRDGGRCRECGVLLVPSVNCHYDHNYPWSLGGGSNEENVQLLCSKTT